MEYAWHKPYTLTGHNFLLDSKISTNLTAQSTVYLQIFRQQILWWILQLTRWAALLAAFPSLLLACAWHLGEGAACFPSWGLQIFPRSVVTWVLHFAKCRELSILPAGQAGARKSEKHISFQIVPTLGTFWNFQTKAVFREDKKKGKKFWLFSIFLELGVSFLHSLCGLIINALATQTQEKIKN